jgi:hypothetical protein
MATAYNRGNAVINQAINLKQIFKQRNILYNPYQVRLVEIYASDPREGSPSPIATYTPTQESTGVFEIETASTIITSPGVYYDKFYFTWEEGETETNKVNDFYVSRSGAINLVGELRVLMRDTHPDTDKRKYTDTELEIYLQDALLDINVTPPAFTAFTLDDWEATVPEWKGLILQGGMFFALVSEGIFQIGIEFTYNDNGISINTNKSSRLQSMASMLINRYDKLKESMKKQYWMQNTHPHATISAPLPIKFRTFSTRQFRYR